MHVADSIHKDAKDKNVIKIEDYRGLYMQCGRYTTTQGTIKKLLNFS